MKSIQRQKNKTLITLIILAVSTLLVYSASAYYFSLWPFNGNKDENVNQAGISTVDDSNDDGKEPVHPSELQDDSNSKQDESTSASDNTGDKLNAHVGVAFASVVGDNLEVRAFASSAIEADATCTAVATKGSETVRGTSKSFIDATTSQCHPILIPLTEFKDRSGTWKVSVQYESDKYSGQSPSYEVSLNEN